MTVVEREVTPEVLTECEQRARTLEAAALEIEVRGWHKGLPFNEAGSVCLVGAVGFASGMTIEDSGWYLNSELTWPTSDCSLLYDFNDNAKSADEVTFLLRWRAEEIRDGL